MPVQFRQLTACECKQLARFVGRSAGDGGRLAARVAGGGPVWRARLQDQRELADLVTRWRLPRGGAAAQSRDPERLRVGQVMAALGDGQGRGHDLERAEILQLAADWERVLKTIVLAPSAKGWAICDGNKTAVAAHEYYRSGDDMALGVLILGHPEGAAP